MSRVSRGVLLVLLVLLQRLEDASMLGCTKPSVLFRALMLSTNKFASQHFLNWLDCDISQLITPDIFGRNVSKSRVIEFLLDLGFIILCFFFLELEGNILIDHSFVVGAGVKTERTECVLPRTVAKSIAEIAKHIFQLIWSEFSPETLLFQSN